MQGVMGQSIEISIEMTAMLLFSASVSLKLEIELREKEGGGLRTGLASGQSFVVDFHTNASTHKPTYTTCTAPYR